MIRQFSFKTFAAGALAFLAPLSHSLAGDQTKAIVDSLDSKSVTELFETARKQPDAALTNITPTTPNTFRFLFIWPASNSVMTYERVGRSFAERFAGFAEQFTQLAVGFCLPSRTMYFGSAFYGEEEVNVAYRDIEVRYLFGWRPPCQGKYIPIAEIQPSLASAALLGHPVTRVPVPDSSPKQTTPEEGLKPFLNPPPAPLP
jgi:hypothetical protein